jgi:hypothetical protein
MARQHQRRNDDDRHAFVINDEGLYNMSRGYKGGERKFVRDNRKMIDEVIDNIESGRKPQHYLAYGG